MQKCTVSAVSTALNDLFETVKTNNVEALDLILKRYLSENTDDDLVSPEQCLSSLKQHLAQLEASWTGFVDAGERDVQQFFRTFIYPLVIQAQETQPRSCDSLVQSVIAVNEALERKVPLATLSALRPFLREHTLNSLNVHRTQGSLGLIAALYHIELGAAKADKGSALTHEELLAASDVLACVVRLNEAIDKHDPLAVYNALISPDAFWEHVYQAQQQSAVDREKWARFYFQRLCKFRDQKSIAGRIPILTHAEIQGVVDQCQSAKLENSATAPDCAKSQVVALHTPSELNVSDAESRGQSKSPTGHSDPIDYLLKNLPRNAPNVTLECLHALQRARLITVPFLDSNLADLYHSFLYFYWQYWLTQFTGKQHPTTVPATSQFPLIAIRRSIERAHRLATRMRELGTVLSQINQALDRANQDELIRCLSHPSMRDEVSHLSVNSSTEATAAAAASVEQDTCNQQQSSTIPISSEYRETYYTALYQLRAGRITNYLHQASGQAPFMEQPRLSLAAAYVQTICPSVLGCGWLWTYVKAASGLDTLDPDSADGVESSMLSQLKVPYFYNTHTGGLIRWPIINSSPVNTSVWAENLSQLRWPIGGRAPPPLDPSLLNREDCALTVMRINKLIELQYSHPNPVSVIPVVDSADRCRVTETIAIPEMPPEQHACRRQHMDRVVRSVMLIQAYWRGYHARRNYRKRLAFLNSTTAQNAAVCLQKHWRRAMAQRKMARMLREHRKRVLDIIRLQSIWRGRRTRLFHRRLMSLVVFRASKPVDQEEQCKISKLKSLSCNGSPSEARSSAAFRSVAQYMHCLDGQASRTAYDQELQAFLLGKRIVSTMERLDEVNKELISSDQLIKLLVRVRLKGRTASFRNEHSTGKTSASNQSLAADKPNEQQTTGHNANGSALPEEMIRLYGQLCYLCYTQPEYVASLLYEIPNASLWKFSVIPRTSGFYHFRPNVYGLSIERLIFGLYRYGSSDADEARLHHLFVRCVHKEMHRLRLSGDTQCWFAEREPWPFILRLAVSMARIKTFHHYHHHSSLKDRSEQDRSVGDCDSDELQTHANRLKRLLVGLVHEIQRSEFVETNSSPTSDSSSRKRCSMETDKQHRGQGWKNRSQSTHSAESPIVDSSQDNESTVADCSNTSESSNLSAIQSYSLRSDMQNLSRGDSYLQQMLKAASDFFYGIFVQPGIAALPQCLVRMMRELYVALRHTFPEHAEKIHLKFVGHCLLHRYFHSCVIAPDVLLSIDASIQTNYLESKHEASPLQDPKNSKCSRREALGDFSSLPLAGDVSHQQRRTLAAISRLLYFVIANKGYGSSKQSGRTEPAALSAVLNPFIRKWHAQFRTFMLRLVRPEAPQGPSKEPGSDNTNVTTPITAWTSSTPDTEVESRSKTSNKDPKSVETHCVVLSVGELFEFHRLLNCHRRAIAPHPSDTLHSVLSALGSAPTAAVPQSSELDAMSQQVDETEIMNRAEEHLDTSNSVTTSSLEDGSCDSITEVSITYNTNVQSQVNTNTHASVAHSWKSNVPKLFSRKINSRYRVCWPRAFDSAVKEHVVHGAQEVVIPLLPTDRSAVCHARLYAAFATGLTVIDCIQLPMRQCHPSAIQSQPGTDERHANCILCEAAYNQELYNLTASLVFGGCGEDDASLMNTKPQRLAPFVGSLDDLCERTGKMDYSRPFTAHGFPTTSECSPSVTSTRSKILRSYVAFDWLEARRVLVELFRQVRLIGTQSSSGNLPLRFDQCPNIRAWIQCLEQWLTESEENFKTAVSGNVYDSTHAEKSSFAVKNPVRKQLRCLLNKFNQIANRLVTLGFLQEADGYHDLLCALARDICHLRAPCRRRQWECAIHNLQQIHDHATKELQMLDQQATVYAAHALDCLVPLDRSISSPWDSRWATNRSRSHPSYLIKISASRLRKCGLISCDQFKWQNQLQMFLEPSVEGFLRPGEQDWSTRSSCQSGLGSTTGRSGPRFVPGMFDMRIELSGMLVHKSTVSLVDLLCQYQRGIDQLPLMNNLYVMLDPLIQLLLDSYYTVR